jgi:hypothetical protein
MLTIPAVSFNLSLTARRSSNLATVGSVEAAPSPLLAASLRGGTPRLRKKPSFRQEWELLSRPHSP